VARNLPMVVIAGMLGAMPLAASSPAVPNAEAGPAGMDAAAAAAFIEIVPVPPTTETTIQPASVGEDAEVLGRGSASYYAAKFDGRRTASGERFDNDAMTAAHRSLPFGSKVRVTNTANGRSVVVRINDRGPFTRGRMIDVSRAAAEELGLVARGHATVELALIGN
jgi:rare lipoprotein A